MECEVIRTVQKQEVVSVPAEMPVFTKVNSIRMETLLLFSKRENKRSWLEVLLVPQKTQ